MLIKVSSKFWLLPFFLSLFFSQINFTQIKEDSNSNKIIKADSSFTTTKDDIIIGLHTGYEVFTSPANFETKDWIYGGLAVAVTGAAFLIDDDIRNNFKKNHSSLLDNISEVGHNYGNAAYAVAFSGTVYLGGKIFCEEKYATTGRMLLEGLFYAGITSTIIKSTLGRSRPYTNDGHSRFSGFQIKTETTSMPSGHVTVAFAMSSVLAERIDNVYASLFLYSLAASTVFQRIYSDSHWSSDTILGALIGYTIGKAVVKFDNEQKLNSVSFSTYYLLNGAGLNFKYSF